ncbi:hypothetical protein [Nocardioides sp. zg-DK7169]|uniref:hypothetical protein n=1 Tax=Nocardioides sp. zg-DK7169 TaxID=2736600 RepID=UPI001555A699|nr:hypothetical protein [Nocardioides sp. zg-DK7169]NPC96569.1 hypothetical protein [Nocardioides sp. zg-DK7169]
MSVDATSHRVDITDLAERLIAEFQGVLAPGLIRRIVYQADHLVLRCAGTTRNPVVLCETIARSLLDERAAGEARGGVGDIASA